MGVVRHVGLGHAKHRAAGDPAQEAEALRDAITEAAGGVAALMARAEGEGQDILAFQLAMLEDEALAQPALAAIAGGIPADEAWTTTMAIEIAGYETSDDDYFRARAADLQDLRDRVLRALTGETAANMSPGCVLVGDDLTPSGFLETDWSQGGAIALTRGSTRSHVAMLARARGVPMVVGLGEGSLASANTLIVDGTGGLVVADPDFDQEQSYREQKAVQDRQSAAEERFRLQPARRRSGERIEVLVNVASVEDLGAIDPASCDGIGLMRSEFLFRDGAPLPDEETQYRAYRRFLEWAGEKPVTIRTLDIGGDKPIAGLTPEGETNPFLGLRGIRLTLAHEEVFRTQLKALLRAAVHGKLKLMLPMVTVPDEIARSAALIRTCHAELGARGVPCDVPPLGIMVEVPAVAVAPELFSAAQFFSIGSNDLTQYVTASSRDDARVAALNDPSHPAVLRLIAGVVQHGRQANQPVSLCGDMASEPQHLSALLDAGLTSFSVAPARLAAIKAAIAER
jgi:phosphotransferase system enzyme I (PtsI)